MVQSQRYFTPFVTLPGGATRWFWWDEGTSRWYGTA